MRSHRLFVRCVPGVLAASLLASCATEPDTTIAPTAAPTVVAEAPSVPTAAATVVVPEQVPVPDAPPTAEAGPTLAPFFDAQRLSYDHAFNPPEMQAWLDTQPSSIKSLRLRVGRRTPSFAEALYSQVSYYSVSPKVILALLEAQSGILSTPEPTADQMAWAVGFQGDGGRWRGLQSQVRWAVRQIYLARRSYPAYEPLTFADGSTLPPRADMTPSEYAIARVLAPTTSADGLRGRLDRFLATYTRLFGDPRVAPTDWPAPAAPFLSLPMEQQFQITSFFDHNAPLLTRTPGASVLTYWGRDETDPSFAYDGHDGWDYAMGPPDVALAAADGVVTFAGAADDGCATGAVVIDHGNGYRTFYWHLYSIDVEMNQPIARGTSVGVTGESGCALGAHLHFGVQYLGRDIDPYGWCGTMPDFWAEHPFGTVSRWLWQDRPSPCEPLPAGAVAVDAGGDGFAASNGDWQDVPIGYGGSARYIPSVRGRDATRPWDIFPVTDLTVAAYTPDLPAGRYRVMAYVPYAANGLDDAQNVRYRIRHAGGEAELTFSQEVYANDWIDLGTYDFTPESTPLVSLSNLAEENSRGVWADAIVWLPAP